MSSGAREPETLKPETLISKPSSGAPGRRSSVIDEHHRLRSERLILRDDTDHPLVTAGKQAVSDAYGRAEAVARQVWEVHLAHHWAWAVGKAGRVAQRTTERARGGYGALVSEGR